MPWDCGSCGVHVNEDTFLSCPGCGEQKAAWTVVSDQTRQLVIERTKVEILRGRGRTPRNADDVDGEELALVPAEFAQVVSKAQARALLEANQLPASAHVLTVRLFPRSRTDRTIGLGIEFADADVGEHEFPQVAEVNEEGFLDARFLFVHGEGDASGLTFDGITVVDLSDEASDAGFAPDIELEALKRAPSELPTRPPLEPVSVVHVALRGPSGRSVVADVPYVLHLPNDERRGATNDAGELLEEEAAAGDHVLTLELKGGSLDVRVPTILEGSGPRLTRVVELGDVLDGGEEDAEGTSEIHVALRSNSGQAPLTGLPYRLHLDSGQVEGTTDDAGELRHEQVPAGDYLLDLTFGDTELQLKVPTILPDSGPRLTRVPGASQGGDVVDDVPTDGLSWVHLALRGNSGRTPLAEQGYTLSIPGGAQGTTDADGVLKHTDVEAGDYTLEVTARGTSASVVVPTVRPGSLPRIVRIRGSIFEHVLPGAEPEEDVRALIESLDAGDVPRCGRFYQVKPGHESAWASGSEALLKVSMAALMNAFADRGLDPLLAKEENKHGSRIRNRDMAVLIEGSPWNDALYGLPTSEIGSGGHYGAHERGIVFNMVHPKDNRDRLLALTPPRRSVTGKASHNGEGGGLPYLWIPALDEEALMERHEVRGASEGMLPPEAIVALGLGNVAAGTYGLAPFERAL